MLIISIIVSIALQFQLAGQNQYNDYKSMLKKIQTLPGEYPQLCSVRSLIRTASGKEIMVITIGSGNKESKPGIAVFGGVEGNYILGRELALGFATSLLGESSSEEIKESAG